ncbi:MAG: hypothetical protein IPJ74_24725 [Saprospiraceae bacterium]|nr:hypothetical protein [Saprospiraceae bacterium]
MLQITYSPITYHPKYYFRPDEDLSCLQDNLPDNARFCFNRGAPQRIVQTVLTPQLNLTWQCGATN